MRNYYRVELKKHPPGRSEAGVDDVTTFSWPLFTCLSYLKDTMQTRSRITNLTQNPTTNNQNDETESQDTPVDDFYAFNVEENSGDEIIAGKEENNIRLDNILKKNPGAKLNIKCNKNTASNFRQELLNLEEKEDKIIGKRGERRRRFNVFKNSSARFKIITQNTKN